MRKLISAVFLALMALIQVHAQDSDLRSAPDLPTFKVTLNYSASEGLSLIHILLSTILILTNVHTYIISYAKNGYSKPTFKFVVNLRLYFQIAVHFL